MQVTFVLYNPDLSGGNRVLFKVANGLVDRGHDIKLIALKPQKWFPLKAPLTVCPDFNAYQRVIPESDVIVATWCSTAYTVDAVKGIKGIPAYYCQHYEPYFFVSPEEQEHVKATYELPLNLIANSPWLQQMLKEKHARDSMLVVPGVDLQTFKPVTQKKANSVKTEQKNGHTPEKLKVLVFSTLTHFKGLYDTTLPALHYAWRHYNKFEVHFYGRSDLPMKYPFPHIHHDFLSDKNLCKLYSECDLYVSGSWYESSPLPHLEAMASGCPVVCTQIGTEHYGNALERVAPRRPRVMGEKIVELLKSVEKRESMRRQGLKDVKKFTWERTVDDAEQFFKNLTG